MEKLGTSRSDIVLRTYTQILVKIILAMLPALVKSSLNKHRLGQKVPLGHKANLFTINFRSCMSHHLDTDSSLNQNIAKNDFLWGRGG